jgi:hypothetical protein
MRRAAPGAACTGSRSGWHSPSIASSAARGGRRRSLPHASAHDTEADADQHGLRAGSTSGSICERPLASTPAAPVHTFRVGTEPPAQRSVRQRRWRQRPGWQRSVGSAPAVPSTLRNIHPPPDTRPSHTERDSADVAFSAVMLIRRRLHLGGHLDSADVASFGRRFDGQPARMHAIEAGPLRPACPRARSRTRTRLPDL